MNLGEATKRIFQSKGKELREVFTLYNDPKRGTSSRVEIVQPAPSRLKTAEPNISTANIGVAFL